MVLKHPATQPALFYPALQIDIWYAGLLLAEAICNYEDVDSGMQESRSLVFPAAVSTNSAVTKVSTALLLETVKQSGASTAMQNLIK